MRFIKEKRPPKTVSVKEQKQPSIRLVRSLFIGITIYLMISGPLALHKVNLTQTQIQKEQETLTKEIKNQFQGTKTTNAVSSDLVKQFLQPFIQIYLTLSPDQQAFETRQKNLQKQYGTIDWSEEKNTGIERKLLASDFYQLTTIQGQQVGTYRIHYEMISPVVKEREVKKKEGKKEVIQTEKYTDYITSKKQVLLNVPFQSLEDGTFVLAAYPYFSAEKELIGGSEPKNSLDLSTYIPIKEEKAQKIEHFIQSFLQKYASDSLEDMAYLMREPELLTGAYTIQNITVDSYTKEKQLVTFLTFDVVDKDTTSSHKEEMTLLLQQRDTTFYIEKLIHFKGEIQE
ncbi:conjugal transfer protein [Enterococcus durans]|uniref:conjugal transfer protein n=1 Tax=Enterococcus durans TaxID=53345 RepID=UPI001D0A00B1|nr:conjugal transfer protein [Enterococcus durans]MCB8504598.1 conjugal transfer protein [Enterococcus durans]MCB8514376.1 conjugal transfer protein [Enterococcus durans]